MYVMYRSIRSRACGTLFSLLLVPETLKINPLSLPTPEKPKQPRDSLSTYTPTKHPLSLSPGLFLYTSTHTTSSSSSSSHTAHRRRMHSATGERGGRRGGSACSKLLSLPLLLLYALLVTSVVAARVPPRRRRRTRERASETDVYAAIAI